MPEVRDIAFKPSEVSFYRRSFDLNERQARFVLAFAAFGVLAEAVRAAGYKTKNVSSMGRALKKNPSVSLAVDQARKDFEGSVAYKHSDAMNHLQTLREAAMKPEQLTSPQGIGAAHKVVSEMARISGLYPAAGIDLNAKVENTITVADMMGAVLANPEAYAAMDGPRDVKAIEEGDDV